MKENQGIVSEASILAPSVQSAQREAETRNAAKRQAERQAKMDAWQDPEVMAYRKAMHEKGAIESLWSMRRNGECAIDRDVPIPPDSELPVHMRGQQPSTVRAFLRGNDEWTKKVAAHAKGEEVKDKVRDKYPELFGIDFADARRDVDIGDEHKVRDGKRLNIKDHPTANAISHVGAPLPKKGAIARFFAGIKDAFEEL